MDTGQPSSNTQSSVPNLQPPIQTTPIAKHERFSELKNFVIKILIGCLVLAAALAIAAILLGGLSDILSKALWTLGLVAIHSLAALAYISTPEVQKDADQLTVFNNAVFAVIVLSFITSILLVWQILGNDITLKLYETYGVLLFAVLHGDMLHKTTGKTSYIDKIVMANYVFMSVVVLMIMPVIYMGTDALTEMYYRFLSAAGIIDATMTIVAVALHRLYLNKHPEASSQLFGAVTVQPMANGQPQVIQVQQPKRRMNPLLLIFLIYIFAQVIISLIVVVSGRFGSM